MEKRSIERRRILKRARVSYGNGAISVDCVMRNISETGALINVNDGLLIPDQFTLHNELDGYKVDCEVVRRFGNSVGVRFVGEKTPIKSTRVQTINMLGDANQVHARENSEINDPRSTPTDNPPSVVPRARQKPVFGKRGR